VITYVLKEHRLKVQAVQGFMNCFTPEVEGTVVLQNVRNLWPSITPQKTWILCNTDVRTSHFTVVVL